MSSSPGAGYWLNIFHINFLFEKTKNKYIANFLTKFEKYKSRQLFLWYLLLLSWDDEAVIVWKSLICLLKVELFLALIV